MTPPTPTEATYEAYRLHQKDVFLHAVHDAALIARRAPGVTPDADTVFRLALALFEKRCEPLTAYQPPFLNAPAAKKQKASKGGATSGEGTSPATA